MADTSNRERRLKRLRYRAWRRGTLEMDLMVGRFADAVLERLDSGQLDRFELLLDQPDPELSAWITGAASVPESHDTDVVRMMIEFNKSI